MNTVMSQVMFFVISVTFLVLYLLAQVRGPELPQSYAALHFLPLALWWGC